MSVHWFTEWRSWLPEDLQHNCYLRCLYLKGIDFGELSSTLSMLQSLTPSLALCCISPCFHSICLSQLLSPPCCTSDNKCSPAQGQPDTLPCIFSSLRLSLWLTSTSLSISALYFSCFAPSWFWVYHVFPALLFFSSSVCVGFPLPFSHFTTSLSLCPSVLSTCQQSLGVKTCWHPLVWQVYVSGRACVHTSCRGCWFITRLTSVVYVSAIPVLIFVT